MVMKPNTNNRVVCAYDFDGTITTNDSMIEFLSHTFGACRLRLALLLVSPWLVAMKLKIIPSGKAKERLLRHFLKGMSVDDFRAECDGFAAAVKDTLIRPQAMESIREDIAQGRRVAIVSASISDWVRPFFRAFCGDDKIDILCTELEEKAGHLTGRFATPNCRGEEKVRRLESFYGMGLSRYLYSAYGDTKGDMPMLRQARYPHYRPWG